MILNKTDYIQEGLRQLNDRHFYTPLERDITLKITTEIKSFLSFLKRRNLLPEEHIEYLTPKNCRTQLFYLLPKIHKANNPGRPIVSACDGPTEKLSAFVDVYLQPLAQTTKSYIKDTNHFLQKLNDLGVIPPESILVTIDVTSLYTNIPHREGILACKDALEKRQTKEPKTWILLRLLHFILAKTCFKFNDKYYEQISGTTMGTKCAPSYAIIFMGKFEEDFLSRQHIPPLVWWRYIDDIFVIWPHSREELDSFISRLNQVHNTIKFTSDISETSVNFLDVKISKDIHGRLTTSLYTKPTDAHLYLHYSSYHPIQQKKSIPYSQAVRIRRICSTIESYYEATLILKNNLQARGYPIRLIDSAISKAARLDRTTLLHPQEYPDQQKKDTIPFILTYNPYNPRIRHILHSNLRILNSSPDTCDLAKKQLQVVYRRPINLKQSLVKADLSPKNILKGSGPCNTPCIACPYVTQTTKLTCWSTKQEFTINGNFNCKSKNVIYVISCRSCGLQYVGQTGNTLNERLRGHLFDIRSNNQYKPVSRHFNQERHTLHDVNVTAVTQTTNDANVRLRTEEVWIAKLQTREPKGLNIIQ